MFDGKDWPSGHVEFINFCYLYLQGVWVLVHWHCLLVESRTKKSFVMICLLPQCDSAHVLSLLGQVQDVSRFNYDHRVDRNHSPCTQNAFFFFQGSCFPSFSLLWLVCYSASFCWNHWVQILGRVVERWVKACWMVKKS